MVSLHGLPGVGKTQTALAFAHKHRDAFPNHVFWIVAEKEDELATGFARIAGGLNLVAPDGPDKMAAVEAARRWMARESGWLLILDNADDIALVRRYFPEGDFHGSILLTRRGPVSSKIAYGIEIASLTGEEGARFLLRRAGCLPGGASLDTASAEDRATALALSRELGGLPLALDQAGTYIEEKAKTPAQYVDLYHANRTRLLNLRVASSIHPATVAVTYGLAYEQVEKANPAAAELLLLCAFLAPDGIPEEIFTKGSPNLPESLAATAADGIAWDDTIESARRLALLGRNPNDHTLFMHRLVQAVLQDRLDAAEQKSWAERAIEVVNDAFPLVEHKHWPQCERLLAHAQVCYEHVRNFDITSTTAARLLNQAAYYLSERAEYAAALPLVERALAIYEKTLGPDHPDTAISLNHLATLYDSQGNYAEALPLVERALAIYEKTLGPDHPDTAISLNNLAAMYDSQGNYAAALPLYEQALAIREKTLGTEHPDTALSINNLASLHFSTGEVTIAETQLRRVISIFEKTLGANHPNLALAVGNLSVVCRTNGNLEEAQQLADRAKEIRAAHEAANRTS